MPHIRIDYDGIIQQASAIGGLASNYEGLNSRLESLSNLVKDGWEGKASQAYANMMGRYIREARSMKEILDALKGYANSAVDEFGNVDRECAAKIRNSF